MWLPTSNSVHPNLVSFVQVPQYQVPVAREEERIVGCCSKAGVVRTTLHVSRVFVYAQGDELDIRLDIDNDSTRKLPIRAYVQRKIVETAKGLSDIYEQTCAKTQLPE